MINTKFLKLTLESNGETLELGNDEYKLLEVYGLESSDYEVNINNHYSGIGGYVKKKNINPREIYFTADCMDWSSSEEQRQRLIKFFNPLNSGTVKVNYCGIERYINYEVESFKDNRTNLYEQLNFTVYIICPDPYFYEAERLEELTTWIGGLNFPLNLPFNLKQRGEDKKNIFNDGHVDTPVEVVFKGPAINPKIVNQTTGKFIQVNRELTSEDTLYITTQYRNKKVEIERNGVRTNAFNYIDLDSTFFNLSVGDNLIEYSTQSLEPQGVSIKYSQKYLGV